MLDDSKTFHRKSDCHSPMNVACPCQIVSFTNQLTLIPNDGGTKEAKQDIVVIRNRCAIMTNTKFDFCRITLYDTPQL